MTNPDKRCGTCRWWEYRPAFKMGDCMYQNDVLPSSAILDHELMLAHEGTNCPCWQPKGEGEE